MFTWIAVKAAWSSFLGWCKERWELLVGVLVGVLGMLALSSSSRDAKKALKEKRKLHQITDAAQKEAREAEDRALRENLQSFFDRDEAAKEKYTEKLDDLDEGAKERVKQLLESDNPEDEIAQALRDYLG